MSEEPWSKDEFTECSTSDFLSAINIAREGVVVSRRWEVSKRWAKDSEKLPLYEKLKKFYFGTLVEHDPYEDEAPEMLHSRAAVLFCERVGRTQIQRGLLTSMIGRFLLEEFRGRFSTADSEVDFFEACSEIGIAAETNLSFIALVENPDQRAQLLDQLDRKIDASSLPLRVNLLRNSLGGDLSTDDEARKLCERMVSLSIAARYVQYVQTATHRTPNSGMREPLDKSTYDRLGVVIRNGGDEVLVSLMTAVNIANNLSYEDLQSKSELAEAAIENASGYLRNTDDFVQKRYITGMRQVIQGLLQKRRRSGVNIAAERFAQLYRITSPGFISWNLSKVDLQRFYRIISAARDTESAVTAQV